MNQVTIVLHNNVVVFVGSIEKAKQFVWTDVVCQQETFQVNNSTVTFDVMFDVAVNLGRYDEYVNIDNLDQLMVITKDVNQ